MPLDVSDEAQLLGATAQGRCIFTFIDLCVGKATLCRSGILNFGAKRSIINPRINSVRDFLALAQRHPRHGGTILAAAPSGGGSWTLSDLIAALDRLLSETGAGDWDGQVRWLNQWRR
jgi:hypothetical protein